MTVIDLKKYIYENGKIEFVLNEIGCGHIVYHKPKEYYSCSNPDGDNKGAITVKNNEYLNCKDYTRKEEFRKYSKDGLDENADLITLVQFIRKEKFRKTIKYLHEILGLKFEYSSQNKKSKEEKIDPLYIFKKVKKRRVRQNVLEFNVLDEEELSDFIPNIIHIDWYREGIMPWTVKRFGLAYSYKNKRNVVPLRYWLTGELLGFTMRTTVENYSELEIPKYFISPGYMKQFNLFGLWENREEIESSEYVVVFESEKSVLKRDSLNDRSCVAVSGHEISDEQARILISLDKEIIICFDKDIDINHIRHCCEKFYHIRKVSYMYDKWDLLGQKDSPSDARNQIYEFMRKLRTTYNEQEHQKYLKSLEKRVGA